MSIPINTDGPCLSEVWEQSIYRQTKLKANQELLSSIIEKCEALKYSVTTSSELLSPVAEVEEICELLYKLEKELE